MVLAWVPLACVACVCGTCNDQDFGLDFSEEEFFALWNYFDRDHSGFIDFGEFLRGVRGPMNATRTAVVSQAFEKLDRTGDGTVTVEDLRGVYSAAQHPDVSGMGRA